MQKKTWVKVLVIIFLSGFFLGPVQAEPYQRYWDKYLDKLRQWKKVPHDDRRDWRNRIYKEYRGGIKRFRNKKHRGYLWYRMGKLIVGDITDAFEASVALENAVENGYVNQDVAFCLIRAYRNMYVPRAMDRVAEKFHKQGLCHEGAMEYLASELITRREMKLAGKWADRLLEYVLLKDENSDFYQKASWTRRTQTKATWIGRAYGMSAEVNNKLNNFDTVIQSWNNRTSILKKYKIEKADLKKFAYEYARACYFKAQIYLGEEKYKRAYKILSRAVKAIEGRNDHLDKPHSQIEFLRKIALMRMKLGWIRPKVIQKNLVLFAKGIKLDRHQDPHSNMPLSLSKREYFRILKKLYPRFKPNWGNVVYLTRKEREAKNNKATLIQKFQIVYRWDKEKKRYMRLWSHHIGYLSEFFKKMGYTKQYNKPRTIDTHDYVIKKSMISYKVIKPILEVFSRGKYSIQFKTFKLDSYLSRKIKDRYGHSPDYHYLQPFPSEIMYKYANYDSIYFFYNRGMAYPGGRGGTGSFPVIPYHLSTPIRGNVSSEMMTFDIMHSSSMSRFELALHEYFHSIEGQFGLSSHIWRYRFWKNKKYADYPKDGPFHQWNIAETREYPWYDYALRILIPKKIRNMKKKGDTLGWKKVLYGKRYPFTMSRETFEYNLEMTNKVSLENRRTSYEIYKKARKELQNKNKDKAYALMKKAFKINPALYQYYDWFGKKADREKRYTEAVQLFKKYVRFTDDWRFNNKIGLLLHYQLKNYTEAVIYYKKALDGAQRDKDIKFIEKHLKRAESKL